MTAVDIFYSGTIDKFAFIYDKKIIFANFTDLKKDASFYIELIENCGWDISINEGDSMYCFDNMDALKIINEYYRIKKFAQINIQYMVEQTIINIICCNNIIEISENDINIKIRIVGNLNIIKIVD